jgi:hypothetical protein
LIGDSFTEGIGLPFENTFAGMLFAAGQRRSPQIEFLNAGVASYSPSIHYKKVTHYFDQGLRFDELVVLPDMSDVHDEASKYFCIDADPKYRAHCRPNDGYYENYSVRIADWLQKRFVVTDAFRMQIKSMLHDWRKRGENRHLYHSPFDLWATPEWEPDESKFAPLGVEGGVTRSLANMQRLVDWTKARGIKLTIAIYPWGVQIASGRRSNRQTQMYQEFCERNSVRLINLFPDFFAASEIHSDWRSRYFLLGDFHYNAEGNRLMFDRLAKHLL